MTAELRSIGIAIGIPDPYGQELQIWRERLGDPNAKRIVPHVTLLPPTPIDPAVLPEIDEHLRQVASRVRPFDIRLRGSATFLPVSPVVFVSLVQGIAECEQLERDVRSGPLARDIGYPYHPHVTVAHDLPREALRQAYLSLSSYEAAFRVMALTLFEQGLDQTWRPQRDFTFGGAGLLGPPEQSLADRSEGW